MPKKIFISYSWSQADWVENYLLPILDACDNHEPIIDRRHFVAGRNLNDQMKGAQDSADQQLLCFSADYLESEACQEELRYALKDDALFDRGNLIPLVLEKVALPEDIKFANPLYVRFDKDGIGLPESWDGLCQALGVDLGVPAFNWLKARDEADGFLNANYSVNLITQNGWRSLIDHLIQRHQLASIDFYDPRCRDIEDLVELILEVAGQQCPGMKEGKELIALSKVMTAMDSPSKQAWLHFEEVMTEAEKDNLDGVYNRNFFNTLRYLNSGQSKSLILLIASSKDLGSWLMSQYQSQVEFKTVKL